MSCECLSEAGTGDSVGAEHRDAIRRPAGVAGHAPHLMAVR